MINCWCGYRSIFCAVSRTWPPNRWHAVCLMHVWFSVLSRDQNRLLVFCCCLFLMSLIPKDKFVYATISSCNLCFIYYEDRVRFTIYVGFSILFHRVYPILPRCYIIKLIQFPNLLIALFHINMLWSVWFWLLYFEHVMLWFL